MFGGSTPPNAAISGATLAFFTTHIYFITHMSIYMREKLFEQKIRQYLESRGHGVVKYFANGYTKSGIPDLLACVNGRFVAIEVKGDGGNVSPLQVYTLSKISVSGGIAMVVYPSQFEKFCRKIEEIADDRR